MNLMPSVLLVRNVTLAVLAANLSAPLAIAQASQPFIPEPTKPADTRCSVVDWRLSSTTPALTVVCPPKEVFAPLRVYLRLSWAKEEDVPSDYLSIVALPGTQTKMRVSKPREEVLVWLKVYEKGGGRALAQWVSFNRLVDVGLLNER
ncbi:MAG: hypothetical protein L0387_22865 [Acidobacteria bacterium]|nr:hypothetical protein [Acidobacteriota bacterium]MCI0723891.1 hypothetical protein [Acidobacteriota bacterium]